METHAIVRLLMLMLLPLSVASQHRDAMKLIDRHDGGSVAGAHVFNAEGKVLTTSNHQGMVRLSALSGHITLLISHIGYLDTTLSLNPGDGVVTLHLTRVTRVLSPHTVVANPRDLIPDKPWYVSSFLICDEGIMMLAYPQRKSGLQSLFLVNELGEVLTSMPWKPSGDLFRDAAGCLWIRGNEVTLSIHIEQMQIIVGAETIETRKFNDGIAKIDQVIGNHYYFGHYHHDNQWLDYYSYNHNRAETRMIESIADPLGMKLRETRHIFETNEFEQRFGEMCFFAPVFAPLASRGSQLIIFNYTEGKIELYDTNHTLQSSLEIDYHQTKKFKKILLSDRISEKYYSVFEERGIYTISPINLDTGRIGREITIPSFPFIEQLTVHNDRLYFLYRDRVSGEYKKIYTMPI